MPSPDFQPTLTGTHLTLRPVQLSDWEGLFRAASDPKIWAGHTQTDRYKEEIFRGFFDSAIASQSALVVIDRATNELIGSSRYHGYDQANSEVEIGWSFLAHKYWGRGFNAEMKRIMLEHAFQFVDTVVFWVAVENEISAKAMRKIGGVPRKELIQRPDPDGSNDVYRIFEITRAAFTSGPLSAAPS